MPDSLLDKLMRRTEVTGFCWLWIGTVSNEGYGMFPLFENGRRVATKAAHRLFYEQLVGPIPDGLQLDHLCRVRHCVNPDHLEPVTQTANVLRGIGPTAVNAGKTHCVHGHPFTPDNTYINKQGNRHCRACAIRRAAEHKARNRKVA